jgi:DNA polymerase III epsilon subunit-like protein
LGTFSELANPGRPIPYQYATAIHGITDADVAGCDSVVTVWNRFYAWAGSFAALVAHNAPFERRFIDAIYQGHAPQFQYVCTLKLARQIYLDAKNHKLVTLCAHIGYQIQNAHRALPDARATAHLFVDMIRRNPSVINQFAIAAPQAPKAASVQPKTKKPIANTGRGVSNVAPLPDQWRAITQLLGFKNAPDLNALQETMPDVYDIVVNGWATWNHEQQKVNAVRILETFSEIAKRNAKKNTVSSPGTVSPHAGLKSAVASEIQSVPVSKPKSPRESTGEKFPKRPSRPTHTTRTEFQPDALTAVEERVLIAAEENRRQIEEANCRKREAEERARAATETESCNRLAKSAEHLVFTVTQTVFPDGRVLCGRFLRTSVTGRGVCSWPDGRVYEGDFVDGEMTGQGQLMMPNGQIYSGDFVKGKIRGNAGHVQQATSTFRIGLDKLYALPSEPMSLQEPKPKPRQRIPVVNEIAHSKRADDVLGEVVVCQRDTEDRDHIAADEQHRTQELEVQEKRRRESAGTAVGTFSNQNLEWCDTVVSTPQRKGVGVALGLSIYVAPWLFAWITLLPGYSKTARYVSFGWLSFLAAIIFFAATK